MEKMKIAEVITRMDWEGPPDIIRAICRRLPKDQYDVKLIMGITSYPSKPTRAFLEEFKDNIIRVPYLQREINPVHDIAAFFGIYSAIRKGKFDAVHTHTAKAGFLGRIAARIARVPVIVHTPHGNNFYGYFGAIGSGMIVILEKIASFFTDKMVVFTEAEKRELLSRDICEDKRIEIVESGLDLSIFEKAASGAANKRSEFNVSPEDLLVGMVSRLETVKGCRYFVEAAKFISDEIPQARFLIVGDGSLKENLMQLCARMGIAGRVVFTGWRDDVPEILSILDVLVLTSLNEAVGRVLLEAGASGKPVVATSVGGIPDIVKNGKTGILIKPRDARGTAKAVIELLRDGNRRKVMGAAAREWVSSHFDEDKMVREISGIYKRLAGI